MADLEQEINSLHHELEEKDKRMKKELKKHEDFWQEKFQKEKEFHSEETLALKEVLAVLRAQISKGGLEVRRGVENPVQVLVSGSKLVCDAWTQLPGMAGTDCDALAAVSLAYQVFSKKALLSLYPTILFH